MIHADQRENGKTEPRCPIVESSFIKPTVTEDFIFKHKGTTLLISEANIRESDVFLKH